MNPLPSRAAETNAHGTDPSREAARRAAALTQYRRRAAIYDHELAWFEPLRQRAIAHLGLLPGEAVIDVGSGTGLSLPHLARRVGPAGRIVAIEQCPEMLARAAERVRANGWSGIELVCSPVETAAVVAPADAALFHFTHDIMRSPRALARVVSALRPGARVVAVGLRWAGPWSWPVNCFVLPAALHSTTSLEGLAAPWSHLQALLGRLDIEDALMGGGYLATGTVPPASPD